MHDVELEIRDLLETNLGSLFKKYYTGRVATLPINYLPVLMVYGTTTELVNPLTTCKDRFHHTINVEIVTTAFGKVNQAEDPDDVQQAQKLLRVLMEDRESDGTPKSSTVLGQLRRNIEGTSYLFTDNYTIEYPEEPLKVENNTYYRATMTILVHREFNNRS